MNPLVRLPLAVTAGLVLALAGQAPEPATAKIFVTVAKREATSPPVKQADMSVRQGRWTCPATAWVRDTRPVQLWIAIDDDTSVDLMRRLPDLKDFIGRLPPADKVGLAYLSVAGVEVAAPLTAGDRSSVEAALRPPKGTPGISPNPYESLGALLDHWPADPDWRRVVVVLSPGNVHEGGDNNPRNPAVQNLVSRAQREGVVFFGISVRGSGDPLGVDEGGENQPGMKMQGGRNTMNNPANSARMEVMSGQANLRELSEKSGGWWALQAGEMLHIADVFQSTQSRLQRQYWLSYTLPPKTPSGPLEVKVESKTAGVVVSAPAVILIP